jgi:HSP20 family protein
MTDPRDLLLNFERMWREMDELMGDPWQERGWSRQQRAQAGFSPRVDVYYCGHRTGEGLDESHAVVKVELAGVEIETVGLEVSGRELVISGERPVQETEGRVYQQLEIEAGPFKRVVELGAEVVAERAKASYDDGILRVELPLRAVGEVTRRVPIEGARGDEER